MLKWLQRVSGASEAWGQGDFSVFIEDSAAMRVLFIGLTIFALVYDRMWEKLPEDSLAVS